jgi:serine/threonine protein kinase
VNKFGRYKILGELGRGAISVIYEARDLLTGRVVALKTIDPLPWGESTSSAERQSFLTDALSASRLKHPNIVTVYDAGDADGTIYIAMELLEGHDLRRILDEFPSLGMARRVKIAAEIASGIAYAHERGLVHGYVNPSNIFILSNDGLKITDFGLARIRDAAIVSEKHAGYLSYMSPEQIRCDGTIDGRSDIFSLGTVFYEMLTRRLPFNGGSPAEIMQEVLGVEPPLPSEVNPYIPPVVDGMVLSMLAKDPDDRVPNTGVVLRGLRLLEEELGAERASHTSSGKVPASANVATPTASAHTSDDRAETLALAHERATGRAERPLATYVLIAVILSAAGLSALWQWQHYPDSSETRIVATNAEPEVATASGPALETEPSVAALAIPPAAMIAPHSNVTTAMHARATAGGGPLSKTALLVFAVSPWGEIYINGKLHGTTPPIATLDLPPGRHRIEVRNPSQPAYVTYATVRAGDVRRIRHEFD